MVRILELLNFWLSWIEFRGWIDNGRIELERKIFNVRAVLSQLSARCCDRHVDQIQTISNSVLPTRGRVYETRECAQMSVL